MTEKEKAVPLIRRTAAGGNIFDLVCVGMVCQKKQFRHSTCLTGSFRTKRQLQKRKNFRYS